MSKGEGQRSLLPLFLLFMLLIFLSLLLGRYPRPGFLQPGILLRDPLALRVFLHLRLPRVATAALLGVSLGGAGCAFQMLFRNPLVEPGFLGVSQGAAFGAAGAILFLPALPGAVELSAVAFALAGLSLSYAVARRLTFGGWVVRMVISGLAVSALFSSGVGILKYLADPLSELPELTFWMLGGLGGVTRHRALGSAAVALPGVLALLVYRWRLNLLSLDDRTAFSLGARPSRERSLLLLSASMATAGVTSVAGIVGWVGLLVPHLARRFYGAEGSRAIPASLLIGGIMVLLCDGIARTAFASEIPLGILTSALGASLFLLLLASGNVRFRR
ncbi:MAG: FecCD family ABC transporter permease [Alkalispirochaetaceae bacterium]